MTKGNAHELIFAEGIRERRKQAKKDGDGRVSVVSVLEGAKAPGTVECYKAKVRKLERIMRKANGLSDDENITIDKEDFLAFIVTAHEEKLLAGVTIEGYRAALAFHQKGLRAMTWADDADVCDVVDAFRHKDGLSATARGTVSEPMAKQLFKWIRTTHGKTMADVLKLQYRAALRVCQLKNMKVGDLHQDTGDKYILYLFNDKRVSMSRKKRDHAHQKIVGAKVAKVFNRLAAGKKRGKQINIFTAEKLRRVCKEGAKALNFPTRLKFDGSHILRHGGTPGMVENAREAFADQACAMSRQNRKKYEKPISQR